MATVAPLPATRPAEQGTLRPFDPEDPRATHLIRGAVPAQAVPPRDVVPVHLLGVPFDGAVLGRRGCAGGPAAIREAFRYFTTYDMVTGTELAGLPVVDQGDLVIDADTRTTHDRAADAVAAILAQGAIPFVLGGDNSLTYAHLEGLARSVEGRIGIVVVDAHYDLRRPKDGVVSSGTPFYRILKELTDKAGEPRVRGADIVEIGIRPFANSGHLARVAAEEGVHVITDDELRRSGIESVTTQALGLLDDVDHLWFSVDMDGVDQAYAPGVSAPTPGGLTPHDLFHLARSVASEERFVGLDILETAPNLDPTGNTARVAARCVLAALQGHAERR